MEYDVDYVRSVFTYPCTQSEASTDSKLHRYKRLISRRSKVLTTRKKLATKRCKNQLFVFDSCNVQQTIVINCDSSSSANGNTIQEQVMITDTIILNERCGNQAFDHSYASFNISQPADASNLDEGSGRTTELEQLVSK